MARVAEKRSLPWEPFYHSVWMSDPDLSGCSPATRGIWIDALCAMWQSGRVGTMTATVEGWARICRCTPKEFLAAARELDATKTANVTFSDKTITLCNRRMAREHKVRKSGRERKKRFDEKRRNAEVTPPVTPDSQGEVRAKSLYLALAARETAQPEQQPGESVGDVGILPAEALDGVSRFFADIGAPKPAVKKFVKTFPGVTESRYRRCWSVVLQREKKNPRGLLWQMLRDGDDPGEAEWRPAPNADEKNNAARKESWAKREEEAADRDRRRCESNKVEQAVATMSPELVKEVTELALARISDDGLRETVKRKCWKESPTWMGKIAEVLRERGILPCDRLAAAQSNEEKVA